MNFKQITAEIIIVASAMKEMLLINTDNDSQGFKVKIR